jgi:hypothetical protein
VAIVLSSEQPAITRCVSLSNLTYGGNYYRFLLNLTQLPESVVMARRWTARSPRDLHGEAIGRRQINISKSAILVSVGHNNYLRLGKVALPQLR